MSSRCLFNVFAIKNILRIFRFAIFSLNKFLFLKFISPLSLNSLNVVEYPQTRVSVGENMESRIEISDPFNMNKPVREHGGYLAMVVTNELGVQVEYEAFPGLFLLSLFFFLLDIFKVFMTPSFPIFPSFI